MKEVKESPEYWQKISNYQEAIHNCTALKGLLTYSEQNGDNDPDDRYWSSIFHKSTPDHTFDKETQLGLGFSDRHYSIVFVYDHLLNKSLWIKGDLDPQGECSYYNNAKYAQCFDTNYTLVIQFKGALMLYKLHPKTMKIVKTIDSRNTPDSYERFFSDLYFQRVVFEKTGKNYLASITHDGNPTLVKFDWKTGAVQFDSLPGYQTSFGGLHCLFVKELPNYPLAILGIRAKQKSDPDMGYSLFIQNGGHEKGMNLYNFKNEFFQSSTPGKFTFSKLRKDGYIQINVYSRSGLLLTKTIVPTNLDFVRISSSTVPIADLARSN